MFQLPRISRVAVIGAGPGGLAAARALRDEGAFDTITVFERNSKSGGTWIYSERPNAPPPIPSVNALDVDPPNQPAPSEAPASAIYENLHTNLPKNVMQYRDIPFPSDYPLFPTRNQVLDYIQSVAKDCDLLPMVRFNTTVVKAEPQDTKWQVSATEWHDNKETSYTESYDAVVVASGHYSVPYLPDVQGLKEFAKVPKHLVIHSREYRRPEDYGNKTVLVVGNGSSSADLVREISTSATKVYHCVRGDDTSFSRTVAENMPKNAERVGALAKFSSNEIECQDGKRMDDVDTVIFATGYLYSFPFLPFERDALIVDGQKVLNLYEHLFYVNNPTLTFIGLPIRVVPMPLMQLQSTVVARCFSGKIHLPSQEKMKETIADETNDRKELVMKVEKELAYVERLGAWAEGYKGNIDDWNSSDVITGRLSEKWREDRCNSLALRRQFLGY